MRHSARRLPAGASKCIMARHYGDVCSVLGRVAVVANRKCGVVCNVLDEIPEPISASVLKEREQPTLVKAA
jgi:hypothetical protein